MIGDGTLVDEVLVVLLCLRADCGGGFVGVDSVESDSDVPEEDLVVADLGLGELVLSFSLEGSMSSI